MRLTQEIRDLATRLTALEERRQMDVEDQMKRLQVGLLSTVTQAVCNYEYVAHTRKSSVIMQKIQNLGSRRGTVLTQNDVLVTFY